MKNKINDSLFELFEYSVENSFVIERLHTLDYIRFSAQIESIRCVLKFSTNRLFIDLFYYQSNANKYILILSFISIPFHSFIGFVFSVFYSSNLYLSADFEPMESQIYGQMNANLIKSQCMKRGREGEGEQCISSGSWSRSYLLYLNSYGH